MDKKIEKIKENIEKRTLNADSLFMFRCTMCGDCCRHRTDILLNPYDLFKLAKGLNMTPDAFQDKYCDVFIGSSSNLPVVKLQSQGVDSHCIFLKENKCTVQDFKPTVCAMFPIGRYSKCDNKDGKSGLEIHYMFNEPDCGDKREIHSVRGWLSKYNIPLEDEFFHKWSELLGTFALMLNEFKKSESEDGMQMLWTVIHYYWYMNYDLKQEFLPQFLKNSETLVQLLNDYSSKRKGGKK